jgi:Na+/proline symporter
MASSGGLMFGIINIIGNFGTVFVDQSYWQSAIAAKPNAASRGYLLGGICWFAIPFALATSLGLASTALKLNISADEAGQGLVPPAVAAHLFGDAGAVMILVMLFMAIVSTGSAESIAVSSLVSYDVYRQYFNPKATGADILWMSRIIIVAFGLFMGVLSIILHEIGLNLGWVYLFMGICIGSAVAPLWNLMTWKDASAKGAVVAAWSGLVLALIGWIIAAVVQSGEVTIDALGTNEVMLTGNLIAIFSSAIIHYVMSKMDPQDYDWNLLNEGLTLVEEDLSGLENHDAEELKEASTWIKKRGYALTFILIVVWPLLSIAAGVFSESYFCFWVMLSMAWGFGACAVVAVLPLYESWDEITAVFNGVMGYEAAVVVASPAAKEHCPA